MNSKVALFSVFSALVVIVFLTYKLEMCRTRVSPVQVKDVCVHQQIFQNYNHNTAKASTDRPPLPTPKTTRIPLLPVRNEDWNAKFPNEKVSTDILQTDWWQAARFLRWDFARLDMKCTNKTLVGKYYICSDKEWKINKPCLVYSFGIAFDYTFDDDMAALGCEVHSFDPSMGVKDHVRNNSVHFHAIGLAGKNTEGFNPRKDRFVKKEQKWTILTLGTIMAALGHSGRTIDVLKIDIEGHEWSTIDYMYQSGLMTSVRQFILEYHLFPDWPLRSEYTKLLRSYKRLSDSGYKKFYVRNNENRLQPKIFLRQDDISYINTKFIPPK